MGVPGCDPWVQLTDKCSENVRNEDRRNSMWLHRYGNPVAARSATFGRVGAGSQHTAEASKYCHPTGALRPGIDPLPHHYAIPQNHHLIRANLNQHIAAMAHPTKPRASYEPRRDTSYMSPTETTDKDPDFMYRTSNRLFDTVRYLPSRERRLRAENRAAATLRELPGHLTPPRTGAAKHSFMGENLLATQHALLGELKGVMEQLEDGHSLGPTPRTNRGLLSSRSHIRGVIQPPYRVGPFAAPDRNSITAKDGEDWKHRFDNVMGTATDLFKKRQQESRKKVHPEDQGVTRTKRADTPPHQHGDSVIPLC